MERISWVLVALFDTYSPYYILQRLEQARRYNDRNLASSLIRGSGGYNLQTMSLPLRAGLWNQGVIPLL